MVSSIIKKVFKKGFQNFAKTLSVESKRIQFIISTKDAEACEPVYKVYVDGKPTNFRQDESGNPSSEIRFREMEDLILDVFNKEEISRPVIQERLKQYAIANNASPLSVFVMVMAGNDNEPFPYLFVNNKQIGGMLDWSEIIHGHKIE